MPSTKSPKKERQISVEDMTYEQALTELEAIVNTLEATQHSLDESMSLFERGQALVQHLNRLLDQAELKIQQLSGESLTNFTPPS